jgi:tetratricopeptide (TPR) repeat protein
VTFDSFSPGKLIAMILFLPLLLRGEESALKQGLQDYEKGDFEKAATEFTEAIRLDPKSAVAYFNRGNCHASGNDFDGAIADWSEAIRLDPKDPDAYDNRGNGYLQKGEYDKALADADAALKINPKLADALSMRGCAHLEKGDSDKAIADFSEAIRLDPQLAAAYHNRGRAYAKQGDCAKALADYHALTDLNHDDAEAHNQMARLLATCADAAMRDGKKAVIHANIACEMTGWNDPMMIQTLAAACAETGDFAKAIEWQTKFNETPGLHGKNVTEGKARLALYEAHKAFHEEKAAR